MHWEPILAQSTTSGKQRPTPPRGSYGSDPWPLEGRTEADENIRASSSDVGLIEVPRARHQWDAGACVRRERAALDTTGPGGPGQPTEPGRASAAEDLLEIVMRRYECASTIITVKSSNRPIEDWPKLFGDTPAVTVFLDRLMHHCHLIQGRPPIEHHTGAGQT
jgi:hypothetical protein